MLGDGQAVTRGETVCLLNLGQEGSGSFCKHTRSRPGYRSLLSHICCSHMPSRLDNTQPLKHQTLTSCCGLYIISDITHSSGTDWRSFVKRKSSRWPNLCIQLHPTSEGPLAGRKAPHWPAMFLVLVVTEELREFLARARSGTGRLIQVLIRDGEWAEGLRGSLSSQTIDESEKVKALRLVSCDQKMLCWPINQVHF